MDDMRLLIGGILAASVISTVFWMMAGYRVRPLVMRQPYLHLVTIYLTVVSFLLLNLFTFSAVFRWLDGTGISIIFGFLTGVQTVAGISAYLFVRRTGLSRFRGERRHIP